jgi:drug/metabolite transporter (DMT)-like permease
MALISIIPAYCLNVIVSDQFVAGRGGVLMMTEVLIGFVSAFLLANELITIREALGALFILSAPLVELHYSKKDN